jgi:hypothetical protein
MSTGSMDHAQSSKPLQEIAWGDVSLTMYQERRDPEGLAPLKDGREKSGTPNRCALPQASHVSLTQQ